jgi:hypothetical protein
MRVEPVVLHPFLTKQIFLVVAVAFGVLALVFRASRKQALRKI